MQCVCCADVDKVEGQIVHCLGFSYPCKYLLNRAVKERRELAVCTFSFEGEAETEKDFFCALRGN